MTDLNNLNLEERQAVEGYIKSLKRTPALVIDLDDTDGRYIKVVYIAHKNIFAIYGIQRKPLFLYADQIDKLGEAFEKGLMDYVDEHDSPPERRPYSKLESNHEA